MDEGRSTQRCLRPVTLEPPQGEHAGVGEATAGFAHEGSPSGWERVVFSCTSSGSPVLSSPGVPGLSDSRIHPGIVLVREKVLQLPPHPGPPPTVSCWFSVKSALGMVPTFRSPPTLVWFLGPSGAGAFSDPEPSSGSLGLGPLWPWAVEGREGVINH